MNKFSLSFQNFNQVEILHIHKTNLKKRIKKEGKESIESKKYDRRRFEKSRKNSAEMEER